jgi:hypothetical protein
MPSKQVSPVGRPGNEPGAAAESSLSAVVRAQRFIALLAMRLLRHRKGCDNVSDSTSAEKDRS